MTTSAVEAPSTGTSSASSAGADESDQMRALDVERGYCNVGSASYSPRLLEEAAFSDPLGVVVRATKIVTEVLTFSGRLIVDDAVGRGQEVVPIRAEQLRELLCRLGPSFVKAGQVLANRPDVVRADYMAELTLLQDDVPAFPDEQAVEIMEKQFGKSLDKVFKRISPQPIAAASLGQVYKAELMETGEAVAVKVQRPGIEPVIMRDLYLFRQLARFVNPVARARLGCDAELILDEFGTKLLEELDYNRELSNMKDFYRNFDGDPLVKIPKAVDRLSGPNVLVMEWIDGIRCTDVQSIQDSDVDVNEFIRVGVVSGLRQLLEYGLFHGDPHPGNIFAMRDGRIAYVDFGNVAEVSQQNKETLVDAVVHAVNEDYEEMAGDFVRLGFLSKGVDVQPIVPALEKIWQDSTSKSLSAFNFRTVTGKFNELVYQYPIRIPERYALVIRSLLTQEGICMTLVPEFKFLEVAYPYIANRLLTDSDPGLRQRLIQVLFRGGEFQWSRLERMIELAKDGGEGLELRGTVVNGTAFLLSPEASALRAQLVKAFTADGRLHTREVQDILRLLEGEVVTDNLVRDVIQDAPQIVREAALAWTKSVLA